MKVIGKLIIIFSVLLFLWMMSAAAFPISPKRLQKYSLCNIPPSSHVELVYRPSSARSEQGTNDFLCKFDIPEMMLYKALTLNVTYEFNQPAFFEVTIRRSGMGPIFKPVQIAPNQINKPITSSWLLDDTDPPNKLNWLSGPYEEVFFKISNFDPSKELIFKMYEVYLL